MRLKRRHIMLSAALALPFGLAGLSQAQSAAAKAAPVILVVGDSLSAEYGIARGTGWVALLEKRLAEHKISARIINASVSGDTTSGGRARLPALLAQHKPSIVVLELGANDALRGLPLKGTEDNLRHMTQASKTTGAQVLLVGIQVPPNYGGDYTRRFSEIFPRVAQTMQVGLVPFMLAKVADAPDATRLFQPDRIHPLATAHPQILDNIWPELRKLLP